MRVVLPSILNDPHTENLLFSLIFVNMKDAIPQQRNAADTWTAKTVLDESKVDSLPKEISLSELYSTIIMTVHRL